MKDREGVTCSSSSFSRCLRRSNSASLFMFSNWDLLGARVRLGFALRFFSVGG